AANTAGRSATSHTSGVPRPSGSAAAAARARSPSTSTTPTRAPSLANASAIARPMPPPAPLTNALLPSSLPMVPPPARATPLLDSARLRIGVEAHRPAFGAGPRRRIDRGDQGIVARHHVVARGGEALDLVET